MYYVYLLRSRNDNGFYIGFSSDLQLRLLQHANGEVQATKYRRPLDLVYYESYGRKDLATARESGLKKFGSAYAALMKRLGYK